MVSFSSKIAYFIILSGVFVVLALVAANYQNASGLFYSLIYLVLFFIFFFGIFVGKSLSWSLKKIVKAADELADGNLQSRVYIRNNDELGQLAKSLNKVAEKLEKSHYEKERIRHVVAMKVNSTVQPFYETIEALEQKTEHRTMEAHKANELLEKMQIDLVFKEAELIDLKGKMVKLMKRKSKKVTREEV